MLAGANRLGANRQLSDLLHNEPGHADMDIAVEVKASRVLVLLVVGQ
jgi:hypothetical protein